MTFKGYIFDMDGTLVDNMHFHNLSWQAFFKIKNIHISPEEFDKIHKGTLLEVMQKLMEKGYNKAELLALGQEKEQIYRDLYAPHIKAIDGLHDFLDTLKTKNHKIALATMGDWNNIRFIFKHLAIEPYFDVIMSGSDVKKGKPHPEIFKKAAQELRVKAHEAVVFEDSFSGFEAAKKAKIATVGIVSTLKKEQIEPLNLYKVIHNYRELL